MQRRFAVFVDKLLIKIGGGAGPSARLFLLLFPSKVLRRRLSARDEKGTPVRIRDYARSCEFRHALHTLGATAPPGREGVQRERVRRPALPSMAFAFGR